MGQDLYLIPGCEHEAIVISKGIEVRMEEIIAGQKVAFNTKATTPHFVKGGPGGISFKRLNIILRENGALMIQPSLLTRSLES